MLTNGLQDILNMSLIKSSFFRCIFLQIFHATSIIIISAILFYISRMFSDNYSFDWKEVVSFVPLFVLVFVLVSVLFFAPIVIMALRFENLTNQGGYFNIYSTSLIGMILCVINLFMMMLMVRFMLAKQQIINLNSDALILFTGVALVSFFAYYLTCKKLKVNQKN